MDMATFNRAVKKTRLRPPAIAAAKAVLVLGWRHIEVANAHGLTNSRIAEITRRVLEAANSKEPIRPPGWQKVTVVVPPSMAKAIYEAARRVMAEFRAASRVAPYDKATRAPQGRSSAPPPTARPTTSAKPATTTPDTPPGMP